MTPFLHRFGFPLVIGMALTGCWLAMRPPSKPPHVAKLHDFTGCGAGQLVVRPMDIDGDPDHAVLVIATHFRCDQGDVTVWQTPH